MVIENDDKVLSLDQLKEKSVVERKIIEEKKEQNKGKSLTDIGSLRESLRKALSDLND